MAVSLQQLENDWLNYKPAGQRPQGGRRALMGFNYQISLSLSSFFDKVLKNDKKAVMAFEGLSDLSELRKGVVYLTQVKATLTPARFKESISEFFAVDSFLEDMYKDIRFKVRYQIACKATKGTIRQDLSAEELGLTPEEAVRWASLRRQLLPYVIQGDPSLELAIKLWNKVSRPFDFIAASRGLVLQSLAANESSDKISEKLLKRWQDEQTTEPPPGELLTPSVFQDLSEGQTHILVGQRPSIEDLNGGCFMGRDALVGKVLEVLDSAASFDPEGTTNRKLPIIWISGGSGVGKSALLLQAIRRIVIERNIPVNYLRHFSDQLPNSLMYWSKQGISSLIAVDDLYAPGYRDATLWSSVSRISYEVPYATIMTCGPDDYREAFEQHALAQGAISVIPIEVPSLSEAEREGYGEWYRVRTRQEEVQQITETNFVVAAFLLERRRQGDADIGEFIARLLQRLATYGLVDEFLTALAVNRLGIEAPIKLFQGKRDAINQLVKEGLVQLVEAPGEEAYVQWFHPALARKIYDIVIPPESVETRATHLAQYFSVSFEDVERIKSFLQLLGSEKQRRLPMELVKESLKKIGDLLKEVNPPELNISYIFLWRDATVKTGLLVEKIFPPRIIRKWMTSPDMNAEGWGLLWQILWDYNLQGERTALVEEAMIWLKANMQLGPWNYIWQKLWTYKTKDERLKKLAKEWLEGHTDTISWGYIFQKIYDAGIREDWLLRNGMDGLLNSPGTPADKYLRAKIESLGPEPNIFLRSVTRRACTSSIHHFSDSIGEYIVSRLPLIGIEPLLVELEQNQNKDGSGWWSVLRNLLDYNRKNPSLGYEEKLASIAREWLIGHEDSLLWNYVWRRLLKYFHDEDSFLEQGRLWLVGREGRPGWPFVWQSLLKYLPEDEFLLEQGWLWLVGREDRLGWVFVWQLLLEYSPGDDSLLRQGREWLSGREGKTDWPFVWQLLLEYSPGDDSLLRQGREWLSGREDKPRWNYVWQCLRGYFPDDESLLEQGREWLTGREDNKGWPYIWRHLLEYFPDDESLFEQGREWIAGYQNHPGWSYVWRSLFDYSFCDDFLSEQGRRWLVGREGRRAWPFVWRRLLKYSPDDEFLLRNGREWITGYENHSGWSSVWQLLLKHSAGDDSLLRQGREWLSGREDRPGWPFVWRRLLEYFPTDEFLIELGRGWLVGREGSAEYSFVKRKLQ